MAEKRGRGRPAFQPTGEQRKNVELMSGVGLPHEQICALVRDRGGNPISRNTLEKYFAEELVAGAAKINTKVGQFAINTMLGLPINPENPPPDYKPMTPITNEGSRAGLLQMHLKARMGWRETVEHANAKDGDGKAEPFVLQMSRVQSKL